MTRYEMIKEIEKILKNKNKTKQLLNDLIKTLDYKNQALYLSLMKRINLDL